MANKSRLKIAADPAGEEESDGRRRRSERSRQKIVQAMLDLVRDGDMHPSAAKVAASAGVSLRSVFRHFEDMESLYREMTTLIEGEVMPVFMEPFTASDWRGRLRELVGRRAIICEMIMPIKVAAGVRRFQSGYLMEDYQRFLMMERSGLESILPDRIIADKILFSSIEMVTGFQAWRRMRQDQRLSVKDAEAVMLATAERLVVDC